VIRHMYNDRDSAVVLSRLFTVSDAGGQTDNPEPDMIRHKDLVHTLFTFQMHLTEGFISEFTEIFRDIDVDGDGMLNRAQLEELVDRLSTLDCETCSLQASASLLEAQHSVLASTRLMRRATFSECVDLTTSLISARWRARSESNAAQ